MTAFRCTAKLLKAMKGKPVAEPAPAMNRLGEWSASLVRAGRIQLVLAVSEPTRFAVVLDAAPYATITERFGQVLFKALFHLGIPADMAATEAEATQPLQLAKTHSSSVLGTLNQFGFHIESAVWHGDAHSAAELSVMLAEMVVVRPRHIHFPADRVREAFGQPLQSKYRPPGNGSPPGIVLH